MIAQIAPHALAQWRADPTRPAPVVVDVREPWETALCLIEGSIRIPLGEIPRRIDELPKGQPIVCVCHHGGRSQRAAMFLAQAGFADLYNLRGGITAWAEDVDPGMTRY